jgi:hypothetical protein
MPRSKNRQQTDTGRFEARRTGLDPGVPKKKPNPVRREAARDRSLGLGQKITASGHRAAKQMAGTRD